MWAVLAACSYRAETTLPDPRLQGSTGTSDPFTTPPFTTPVPDTGGTPTSTGDTGPAACVPVAGIPAELPIAHQRLGASIPLGAWSDTPTWPSVVPVVTEGGGALLFSDSPETLTGPGLAYADTIQGSNRLYLYHAVSGGPLAFALLAQGVGGPATVTVTASGRAGPSPDYLYTGRMAAQRWLTSRTTPAAPHVVDVPEGGWVSIDDTLPTTVVTDGRLMHGIWDVEVAGAAEVRFVAVGSTDDALTVGPTLAALPRDGHDRGTFSPADRRLEVPCLDTAAGAVRFRLGDGVADPFVAGVDALGGGTAQTLAGNYGVDYTLSLSLASSDGRWVAVLLAPRGGAVAGAVRVSDGGFGPSVYDFPRDADDVSVGQAVLLGVFDPAVNPVAELEWTPAGSSTLPVDVLVVPYDP